MQQDATYTRTCSHAWANVHKRTGPRVLTFVPWCAMQLCHSMWSMMIQQTSAECVGCLVAENAKACQKRQACHRHGVEQLPNSQDDLPLLRSALPYTTAPNPEPATQLPAYVTEHLPRSRKWCWNSFEDIRNGDMDGHEPLEQTRTEFSELSRVAKNAKTS